MSLESSDAALLALVRAVLSEGRVARVRVFGRSMHPTIASGAVVEVHPCPTRPRPGEVVACQVGERLVAHRLEAWRADGSFVTRGDALFRADSPRGAGDLLGLVRAPGGAPFARLTLHARGRALARRLVAFAIRRAGLGLSAPRPLPPASAPP